MPTSDWMRPTTVEFIEPLEASWTNPANALDADRNSYAQYTIPDITPPGTARLRVRNLLAAMAAEGGLPANVLPVGIEVRQRREGLGLYIPHESVATLVLDGVPIGTDKASGAALNTGGAADKVFGGSADAWGLSAAVLQRSLLEEPGFGFEFECETDLSDPGIFRVYDTQFRVTYEACFLLRNAAQGGDIIRQIDGDLRTFSLAGVLGNGQWHLALTRVDVYGNESEQAELYVVVSGGAATVQLIVPQVVSATTKAAGYIQLVWRSANPGGQLAPSGWEIASTEDLGTVLATVTAVSGQTQYTQSVGPFANGSTARLAIRAKDSGSGRTAWVEAPPAVADSAGPEAPTMVT